MTEEDGPESVCYIVMDYLKGVGLKDFEYLDQILDESVIRHIAHELLRILKKLHDFGIAHADFKPENIIVTDEGKLKLVDFGSQKLIGGNKVWQVTSTPFYSPP